MNKHTLNKAITHLLLNKNLTTDEVNSALDTLCNEYGTEAVARAWMAHATHKPCDSVQRHRILGSSVREIAQKRIADFVQSAY